MGADAPVDGAGDPLAGILGAIADSWVHAASIVQRVLAGTYGTADAIADVAVCTGSAAQTSIAAIGGAMNMLSPGPALPNPSQVSIPIPDPQKGPLHAGPFRGIGWGTSFLLPAADVTLQTTPSTAVAAGAAAMVTITASFDHVSPDELERTVIYEGQLVDALNNAVTPMIRIPKPAKPPVA